MLKRMRVLSNSQYHNFDNIKKKYYNKKNNNLLWRNYIRNNKYKYSQYDYKTILKLLSCDYKKNI